MRYNPKGSSYNSPSNRKGRLLQNTKLETAITSGVSREVSCSARSDLLDSESEDSEKDPFEVSDKEFVIPSPVELSETNADASPSSQY
jgi:hypothetical protein